VVYKHAAPLALGEKCGYFGVAALELHDESNDARNLSQQIVSATPGNFSPNEFAHRGRLRKNDPRIDIGRVGFTARDMRLIDEQF
jgi:hypothetical protein